ncbi:MAG: glycine zipper 2TM domain-containing protein [Pseudomonadota bacterium]|jgi:hypothetical protein|nr:glycine zipper 2TM domain-containing protein [Pseudomonadota bacterium]
MRKTLLALTAASLTLPAIAVPSAADARHHYYRGRAYSSTYCHRRSGTTGTIVGGVGGALLGHALLGGTLGTVAGAGAGALGGRAIERNNLGPRCHRYYR